MKTFIALLLPLLLPVVAQAQSRPDSTVADTLDWHRYYPLAVGNVWEYRISEGEPLMRREIVSDTLAGDRQYFRMVESTYDSDGGTGLKLGRELAFYVRYDSIGAVVALPEIEADTVVFRRGVPTGDSSHTYFDLREPFGDTLSYGEGAEDTYVTVGGYGELIEIGGEKVEAPAVKNFWGVEAQYFETYAADIGLIEGGNLWGPRITYAHVGEITYGLSRVPTSAEKERYTPERFAIESLHPNPTSDRAVLEYRLPEAQAVTVEVFNALGQRLRVEKLPLQAAGMHWYRLETSNWAGGVYFVRFTTGSGQQSARSVIVSR